MFGDQKVSPWYRARYLERTGLTPSPYLCRPQAGASIIRV